MIAKLIAILTSRDTAEQILERIRGNPKTTAVAAVCAALFGCATGLYNAGYLIAAGLVGGITALIACIALLFAGDGEKKQ